jgi:2-hydroxycyclohexanecarboxyl-CoA dehydrogenase
MRGLQGKAIIVTGAASGIGRAVAERLAEEGAAVGIFDLNGEGAENAAGAIRQAGLKAAAYAVDITDYAAVDKAVAAFEGAAGPIEGLVNNAGWDKAAPFVRSSPADWKKIVDINLYGPLNMTHVVLRGMAARGRGRIVSVASDAGRVGSSGEGVYSACKGGVIALTKTLAREHAKAGIILNTVCPGPTDTPLLASFDPSGKLQEALKGAVPMRRIGQPSDYPGLIAFLLSDDAGFITGQTVSISGGLTMQG